MTYEIQFTRDALYDLEEAISYMAQQDLPTKANTFLNSTQKKIEDLKTFPERGTYPKELLDLGIKDYREIHHKSLRIIYRVIDANVFIYIVADGRRDFCSLLERRLLR